MEIKNPMPNIICLLFMSNLPFLVAGKFIVKIKKSLEKARKIILAWKIYNAVTYNIAKIKTFLFFKAWKQKLVKQLTDTQLNFNGQSILFNQKTIRWLRMWLNNCLNFNAHINKKLEKAKIAKFRIKKLNKTYGLLLVLVC